MTTVERLAALEARVAASAALLEDIHLAVVGNGSAGSSLRERTAALEEWRRAEGGLRHKGVRAGANAILTAAVAILVQTLHATYGGHA